MEIFHNVQFDWLGKRYYFYIFSGVLTLMGVILFFVRGGFILGIDFTGGTVAQVQFQQAPDLGKLRSVLESKMPGVTPFLQTFGKTSENRVQIKMERQAAESESVEGQTKQIKDALKAGFQSDVANGSRVDLNDGDLGASGLAAVLLEQDPLNIKPVKTLSEQTVAYDSLAAKILDKRKTIGIFQSMDDLRGVESVTDAALSKLKDKFYAGSFSVQGVQAIGAIVGKDLREKATYAVLFSMMGMLVYIAFRFKSWSYGIGAVVALIHDVLVTLGFFLLTGREISLIVIAALLTLVGYSVNDTIVIYDRIRENLRMLRKENFQQVMNASINQTLNRTILTSGLTFLAVISIFLFGGEVLDGFSFAMVIGIIIGTYSSIAIASPIVLAWDSFVKRNLEGKR
jgi:preprotein translocase subunit SecF